MGDVPGTKVWVGNLGSTCEERDLRDEFSKFGELNKVRRPGKVLSSNFSSWAVKRSAVSNADIVLGQSVGAAKKNLHYTLGVYFDRPYGGSIHSFLP